MSEHDSQRAPASAASGSAPNRRANAPNSGLDDVAIDLGSENVSAIDLGDASPRGRSRAHAGQSAGAEDRVVDGLTRRRLFGLNFVDAPSLEPVIEALVSRHEPPIPGQNSTVLTPNVDIMVQLKQDPACQGTVWDMFESSQFCLPDGQPIVLASRFLGRPLTSRLTGSGLFAAIWPRLVAEQRSIFVVASSEAVAELLLDEYPAAASTVPPMFQAGDAAAIDRIAKTVVAAAGPGDPEFVFLGVGNPKDALVAEAILRLWPTDLGRPPTVLGLGGSASMYVGITKRAPDWVQRIGMEWFFRFIQEPRRLFYRYFIRDSAFIWLIWREWLAQRGQADVDVGDVDIEDR